MFIAEDEIALVPKSEAQRWIHCPAFECIDVAVVGAVFINRIEPGAAPVGDNRIEIGAQPPRAETVDSGVGTGKAVCLGCLGDAVDDAAAAAAPEDHGVGALHDLEPFDIVEVAIILNIVAQAIDEEIGGGVVAAQCRLVAMALALAGGGAGDITQRIGDRQNRLVVEPVARQDVYSLRHIEQWRVGARRPRCARRQIAGIARCRDDDHCAGIDIQRFMRACRAVRPDREPRCEQGRREQKGKTSGGTHGRTCE